MTHAFTAGRLVLTLLLAGLCISLAHPSRAQGPAKASEKKDTRAATPKDKTPAEMPKWELPRLTVVAKTPDVEETVKFINEKLEAAWKANKIVPSRPCDDYEFIRRASLDIIGRIATPAEIQRFLKDPKETRRSLLIDRLLASEEYPRHWANVWANWLLTRSGPFGRGEYHRQMEDWLKDQFADPQKNYATLVKDLITAKGENTRNGAVNFILAHLGDQVPPVNRSRDGHFEMVPITSRITRLFLGIQTQCAQCHPHPFNPSLEQNRFWGVNAFLRQVERKGTVAMRRQDSMGPLTLEDNPNVNRDAKVFYEKRNGVILLARAEFLPSGDKKDGPRLDLNSSLSRREQLAELLIQHDNFPRAYVNRLWGVFFGRGFTNPVDDFNEQNQPTNPDLLDELARRFKHYNYDQKKLIRWICNSHAYNLSHVANRTNDKQEHEGLFARMLLKAMSPEQLFESLMVATGADAAASKEEKRRVRDRWLGNLIANFGDDEGNEVNFNGTVVQALLMMNGEDLNKAIDPKAKGTLAQAMQKRAPTAVITDLYLHALNRPPTAVELTTLSKRLPLGLRDTEEARYQDVFWALLNSNEFILNH
jgi:hypothetical protein